MRLLKAVPHNRGVSQGRADDSTFCTVEGGTSGAQREGRVGAGQLPRRRETAGVLPGEE